VEEELPDTVLPDGRRATELLLGQQFRHIEQVQVPVISVFVEQA
jgi:hypothetical protein